MPSGIPSILTFVRSRIHRGWGGLHTNGLCATVLGSLLPRTRSLSSSPLAIYPRHWQQAAGINDWNSRTLLLSQVAFHTLTGILQIGITVAITGNVLISLALNLQKLAHKRGEAERLIERQRRGTPPNVNGSHSNGISEEEEYLHGDGTLSDTPAIAALLTPLPQPDYGSTSSGSSSLHEIPVTPKKTLLSRLFRSKQDGFTNGIASERTTLLPVNVITEEQAMQTRRPVKKVENNDPYFQDGNEADYLKSRLWWDMVPLFYNSSSQFA